MFIDKNAQSFYVLLCIFAKESQWLLSGRGIPKNLMAAPFVHVSHPKSVGINRSKPWNVWKAFLYRMMFHRNQGSILLAFVSQDPTIKFVLKKRVCWPKHQEAKLLCVASQFSNVVMCSCDFRSMYSMYDQRNYILIKAHYLWHTTT